MGTGQGDVAGRLRFDALSPTDAFLWGLQERRSMVDALSDARSHVRSLHLQPEQLTFWTIIQATDQDPGERIAGLARSVSIERRSLGSNSVLAIETSDGHPFVVSVWPQPDGAVHLVGTVPFSDGRWKRLERWVMNASPGLTPCYLNEGDFLSIGDGLSEFGSIEVGKLTWRQGDQSHAVGYREVKPSLHEAVSLGVPQTGQVRTALLRAGDLSIHLRRLAGATLYAGDLKAFEETVLRRLERAARERLALLQNRARTGSSPVKPLCVKLREPLLRTAEETGLVIEILRAESRLGVAVVHRNPYLHLAVSDYEDGSNFDIFVTNPSEVVVHPGFTASVGSLNRVLQRLSESLPSEEVGNRADPTEMTVEDLLTPFAQ
ncbi:MAG: hypothetical protein M3256_09675 [Actinomycetota bacterium]|nr:hypothetical protein [Actinomycetota bacterium]